MVQMAGGIERPARKKKARQVRLQSYGVSLIVQAPDIATAAKVEEILNAVGANQLEGNLKARVIRMNDCSIRPAE
jgi:hypothetical protein